MGLYDRDWYREKTRAASPRRGFDKDASGFEGRIMRARREQPAGSAAIRIYGPWIVVVLLMVVFSQHGRDRENAGGSEGRRPVPTQTSDRTVAESSGQGVILPEAESVNGPSFTAPSESVPGDNRRHEAVKEPESVLGTTELILEPSENGNFYVKGTINQRDVMFLVDTGASWISIPERLKWPLRLTQGRYVQVTTASGVVGNYETQIDSLTVGPLRFGSVPGALNPYAPNDVVLLGMSALRNVQMIHQDGRLILKQPSQPEQQPGDAKPSRSVEPLLIKRSVRECMGPNHVINRNTLTCLEGH